MTSCIIRIENTFEFIAFKKVQLHSWSNYGFVHFYGF